MTGGRSDDAGAVRVSIDPASASGDGRPIVVARVDPAKPTDPASIVVDGEPTTVTLTRGARERGRLVLGSGRSAGRHDVVFGADRDGTDGIRRREVVVGGWRIEVQVEPERRAALRERARRGGAASGQAGPTQVHAAIPGRVVAVRVAPGDQVETGQAVLVVEAMKMQNEVRAPRDGTVRSIAVGPGTNLEVGDLLLVIE
ncbi:MAG TPA: biotin/lipoyl-containing protein [Candidatus Limnocylindrales bacterium]